MIPDTSGIFTVMIGYRVMAKGVKIRGGYGFIMVNLKSLCTDKSEDRQVNYAEDTTWLLIMTKLPPAVIAVTFPSFNPPSTAL